MNKKIVLLATENYSMSINDYYMFYRRTEHKIVALFYHKNCTNRHWWKSRRVSGRNMIRDIINEIKLVEWSDEKDLEIKLMDTEFDYICMGNGTDNIQQYIID